MNHLNTYRVRIRYDVPRARHEELLEGIDWETRFDYVTIALPSHVKDEEQAEKYLYESAMRGGHEHVRYENLCLDSVESDSDSETA